MTLSVIGIKHGRDGGGGVGCAALDRVVRRYSVHPGAAGLNRRTSKSIVGRPSMLFDILRPANAGQRFAAAAAARRVSILSERRSKHNFDTRRGAVRIDVVRVHENSTSRRPLCEVITSQKPIFTHVFLVRWPLQL